jgi:hypothetical protein
MGLIIKVGTLSDFAERVFFYAKYFIWVQKKLALGK